MDRADKFVMAGGITLFFAWVLVVIAGFAAWVTHVVVCIKASAWILLAFGCLIFPIGVIHGVGAWFGIW